MQADNQSINFRITKTIDEVPPEICNGLFGNDVIEGWGYHKAFESSNIKEFKLEYLLAEKNGQVVAIVPFFITNFSFATLIQGWLQKIIKIFESIAPRLLKIKLLFVGLPTAEQLYIGINPNADKTEILELIINKICLIAKDKSAKISLFYNLSEKDLLLRSLLRKKGFAKMNNFPNTVVPINASSLEDFIEGLGKNMRKDIRRKLKKSSSLAKLETKIFDYLPQDAGKDIFSLYLNNFLASDVHFETLTPEFFENIFRYMPGCAKIFITYYNNKIVAFNLCLIKNDTCIDKFIGFDKEVYIQYHLYFTTFCYNISWCMANNIRFYQMGITDYHPKIRLGAKLVPLSVYFKHHNPILNLLSPVIARIIDPTNFDPTLKKINKSSRLDIS